MAKLEVSHAVSRAGTGVTLLLAGAIVVGGGVLALAVGAILLIALVVAQWLAALIVGGATVILGLILVLIGGQRLRGIGRPLTSARVRKTIEANRTKQAQRAANQTQQTLVSAPGA